MVDFRLGDGGQPSGALRCGKGTVRQQAAAHLTGFIHNIGTEFLLELHNAGRTRQQNFPRHLVGIHTAEPRGTDAVRQVDLPQPERPVMPMICISDLHHAERRGTDQAVIHGHGNAIAERAAGINGFGTLAVQFPQHGEQVVRFADAVPSLP